MEVKMLIRVFVCVRARTSPIFYDLRLLKLDTACFMYKYNKGAPPERDLQVNPLIQFQRYKQIMENLT